MMTKCGFAALTLLLVGCAGGPADAIRGFEAKIANPSAVIAAEIRFNQRAQEKGQWTAFREIAGKDAIMFVPQPTLALAWLNGRPDPSRSVKWQPHKAFMSCDGKTGVTTGAAQWPDGRHGYFTTVWNLDKRNLNDPGEWRWIVDHGDFVATPRAAPEMIETRVASCKGSAPATLVAPAEGAKMKTGLSRDQSLSYTWTVQADGSRTIEVKLWNGQAADTVILDRVATAR